MRSALTIVQMALAAGACQKTAELLSLVKLVARHRPELVLEIGTMKGGTLRAWCECATDDATIISIDLRDGRWGGGYAPHDQPRIQGYAQPGQTLHLIEGDSHSNRVRKRFDEVLDWPIDFLFIDGDHTYNGVRQDFETFSPYMTPGGLVAFHDIRHHPDVPGCEVDRYWNEIKTTARERWEFVADDGDNRFGPWGGIGVMRI